MTHSGAQYLAEPATRAAKSFERMRRVSEASGIQTVWPTEAEDVLSLLASEKARADAAEAERDGWQKIVGELAGAVPLPDIIKATGTTRDLIAYFKGVVRERDEAREALKPFGLLGVAFVKHGDNDDSVWATTPDETVIQVGATQQYGWHLKVGDLRRASALSAANAAEREG